MPKHLMVLVGALVGTVACSLAHEPEGSPVPADFVGAISVGFTTVCVVDRLGELDCWRRSRECGPASFSCQGDDPGESAASRLTGNFRDVDLGWNHGCAIHLDGTVSCWRESGADALFEFQPSTSEPKVAVGVGDFYGVCAATAEGTGVCWGNEQSVALQENVVDVSYGFVDACVVLEDGRLLCGEGEPSGPGQMQEIMPEGGFVRVESGHYHHCAQGRDREVYCWGRESPPQPTLMPGGPFIDFDVSRQFCGVADDKGIICHTLGARTPGPTPGERIVAPPGSYRLVSLSWLYACAVTSADEVVCFGDPSFEGI